MQNNTSRSPPNRPRIVFVVMSAVTKPGTVDQLARALAPHTVLVHHDFAQTPVFELSAPNVRFVPNPKRTGWAVFGFVEGIFHSMQYAVENLEFDYLQVLSPTCLPIKPIESFEAHISGAAEAHFGCIDLLNDRDALMSVGYRGLTPEHSFRHRLARRLSRTYFGASTGRRDEAGIWLRSGGGKGPLSLLALLTLKALSVPMIGRHIFNRSFRPYYGSTWFGARRNVIAAMVEAFRKPAVHGYFSRLCIAEEFLVPTLLMSLGVRGAPINHFIQDFNEAHAGMFDLTQIDRLKASKAHFARKFPDDPAAPIRKKVLAEMVGQRTAAQTRVGDTRQNMLA